LAWRVRGCAPHAGRHRLARPGLVAGPCLVPTCASLLQGPSRPSVHPWPRRACRAQHHVRGPACAAALAHPLWQPDRSGSTPDPLGRKPPGAHHGDIGTAGDGRRRCAGVGL